jgi:GDP-fucose transporter C1
MRIPVMRWNASVANLVAPLTIVYICVLIFNPLFLQYIEVNTYHFSNSLALFYSLLFSYLMMRTVNRQRIITTCSLMVFGTLVSSLGYLNFSLAGVFYAISWPAIFALYGIYMKRSLLALKNDYW